MGEVSDGIAALLALPSALRRLGPFVLIQQLGSGGFAPVWLAEETYGETRLRTVALKLFALDGSSSAAGSADRARILDEARALCQVEHPNIVRFYSLFVDEARGVMGLVMEHLAGSPLDRRLQAQGPISLAETIELGIAIASALAAVHRTGLVHRDVKPGNIVHVGGAYKLIDFGVALGERRESQRPTALVLEDVALVGNVPSSSLLAARANDGSPCTLELPTLAGTLGYVDPECVARGAHAVPASDLYSLGATLFELVTGQLPARLGHSLRGDILDGRARSPSVSRFVSDAPPAFSELVDELLNAQRSARPHSAEWVAVRLQELRGQLKGTELERPPESVGPFRGLSRYEPGDQGVYFGRMLEIAQALQVLRTRGLLALFGPSGSGKSSLARAGVLPAVLDGQLGAWPEHWDSAILTPGRSPRRALLAALAPVLDDSPELTPVELLARLAERVQSRGRGVLVLVDQLEELTTLALASEREFLIEFIAALAEQPLPGIRAMVTARRDLLEPLLELPGLGRALLNNAVLVEAMTSHSWLHMLEQALSAYGYAWEHEPLRQRVSEDLSRTASAMPLVQFALRRWWEQRDTTRKVLTESAYEEMGGIAGALAQHAEATLDAFGEGPEGRDRARRALLALTTPQGTRAVRELAELERLTDGSVRAVLDAFERARLVIRLPGGYTLSHEALLVEWPRLRNWLADARDARLLVDAFERDAAAFAEDPAGTPLWNRRRVAFLASALHGQKLALSESAGRFHAACLAAESRKLRARFALGALALLVAVLAGTGYFSAVQEERTRTHAALERERSSRGLAEARAREVERAQQRIDELLRGLASSPAKAEVQSLQARIRDIQAPPAKAAAPRRPIAAAAPRESSSARAPAPPPVVSARPQMRVQSDW